MNFGVIYELSVPRSFREGAEGLVFHNALEQIRLAADSDAQRGLPLVLEFDPAGWDYERSEPVYPVSAATFRADITLPNLRFLCKPGEMGFTGTEVIQFDG